MVTSCIVLVSLPSDIKVTIIQLEFVIVAFPHKG